MKAGADSVGGASSGVIPVSRLEWCGECSQTKPRLYILSATSTFDPGQL